VIIPTLAGENPNDVVPEISGFADLTKLCVHCYCSYSGKEKRMETICLELNLDAIGKRSMARDVDLWGWNS
jgi:hypothetical protein